MSKKQIKERREQEDKAFFVWLAEHGVTVREIDDSEFREMVYNGISSKDNARRFEVHITDLIYCLRAAWFNKVMQEEFSEDAFKKVWHWLRGIGIEIGTVDALKKVIQEKLTYQKLVNIGGVKGSVDIIIEEPGYKLPYELTTAIWYGSQKSPKIYPPTGKTMQDLGYMAAEKSPVGRVKVYIMIPPKEERMIRKPGLNVDVIQTFSRPERTWELNATEDGINFFGELFIDRGNLLKFGLDTGKWGALPKAYFPWRCRVCSVPHPLDDGVNFAGERVTICEYLNIMHDQIQDNWQNYKREREKFNKEKVQYMIKNNAT